jgi:hypothetical protein
MNRRPKDSNRTGYPDWERKDDRSGKINDRDTPGRDGSNDVTDWDRPMRPPRREDDQERK